MKYYDARWLNGCSDIPKCFNLINRYKEMLRYISKLQFHSESPLILGIKEENEII